MALRAREGARGCDIVKILRLHQYLLGDSPQKFLAFAGKSRAQISLGNLHLLFYTELNRRFSIRGGISLCQGGRENIFLPKRR